MIYRQVSYAHSIYQSIAIPSSIGIKRSRVSRYFDISSIEPALVVMLFQIVMLFCRLMLFGIMILLVMMMLLVM